MFTAVKNWFYNLFFSVKMYEVDNDLFFEESQKTKDFESVKVDTKEFDTKVEVETLDEKEIKKLKKAELIEYAKSKGIEVNPKDTKKIILEKLI